MQTFTSRHVSELDGLRGVSIISVIVHHQLTPFSLPGGFLGVDLFFVLSGFLITGLLADEFARTKTISLRKFYMRRVLRLGPALFFYLLACLIVTHHNQLLGITRQLKLIGFALIYLTNWRMAFGWDPVLDPTAIIWSLSIEEQFYLVWPLLFFGCMALKLRRRTIVTGLAVVIVAIMAHRYSLLNSGTGLTRLYYGTDTRADALLMGCLLALLPVATAGVRVKRWLKMASVFSAAALLYLIATSNFGDQFLYRGGVARWFGHYGGRELSATDPRSCTPLAVAWLVWENFLRFVSLALARCEEYKLLLPGLLGVVGQARACRRHRVAFLLSSRAAFQQTEVTVRDSPG
jgi:peptidoglycan/LPS O-acetylase OafA/YrhL